MKNEAEAERMENKQKQSKSSEIKIQGARILVNKRI